MVRWSTALDAALSDPMVRMEYKLYLRNGYDAYASVPMSSIPTACIRDWNIDENRENMVSALEIPLVNDNFQHNDEFNALNHAQIGSECELRCTVYSRHLSGGSETQVMFHGLAVDVKPKNYSFALSFHDFLTRGETSTCTIDSEADRIEDPGNPGEYFFSDIALKNLSSYDTYTFGVDEAVTTEALGENGSRRAWQVRSMRIYWNNGGADEYIPADQYEVAYPLGVIKFYDPPKSTGTYYIETVSFYLEGSNNVEDVMESALRYPWQYGGPGFGDTKLIEGLTGTITLNNGATAVVGAGTEFTTELRAGSRIRIVGSIWGIVYSITDDTHLDLLYAWRDPSSVGSVSFEKSTLEHAYAAVSKYQWGHNDGYVSDLLRNIREDHTRRNYFLFYDHVSQVIRGQNVYLKTTPDLIVQGATEDLETPRSVENVYTRVWTSGDAERPQNLMMMTDALGARIVTMTGATIPPWTAQTGTFNGMLFTGGITNLTDGDLYTGYSLYQHYPVIDEETEYEFVEIDLQSDIEINRIMLFPIAGKNVNLFPNFVTIEGKPTGGTYMEMDPGTVALELKPNGSPIDVKDMLYNTVRYIRIKMTACKWVSSGTERHIGLGEIRVYGTPFVEAEAKIQDSVVPGSDRTIPIPDVNGVGGWWVGGVFIKDYYPNLMQKFSQFSYRTFLDSDAPIYDYESARQRAQIFLNEYIRMYQTMTYKTGFDPRPRLFDTLQLDDIINASTPTRTILLEEKRTTPMEVVFTGTDYSVGVLS